ncbi:hypothetical protein V494_00835 [Pseudogymnoascus sp. VKM F-4513 (FW-928)]|nr:hypothetical protein V494_00835 [Pseudogymnoascus sp. VKM F-4513 (FW-928)]
MVVATAYQPAGHGINVQAPHEDFVRVDDPQTHACLRAGKALCMAAELADAASRLDIPETHAEIPRAADDDIVAQLDGVDGAGVAMEVAVQGAGGAVVHGDGAVFRAGDDVFVVEGEVEDCGGVVRDASNGRVGVGDGVDDAGPVGGAGDEDRGVVLEAED